MCSSPVWSSASRMAARPRNTFAHKRSVRLLVDEGMELDALTIVKSLPDFKDAITGVVPMFGGKCFDITMDTTENASLLAQAGFDYEHTVKPLRLLGARSIHVSIFVSVEYPDVELLPFLKTYGKMKTEALRRLYYNEEGFTHIERGIRVAEFVSLDKDLPRKIVTNGVEIHFKYTGQPVTCYRCGSTDHVVQTCPQKARFRKTPSPPVDNNSRDPPASPSEDTMDSSPSNSSDTSTPTSYANAASPSLFSEEQDTVELSRKRPPSSPVKEDKPAAKKSSVSARNAAFEKSFLQALKERGPARTKLVQQMDGDSFYTLRSLYLQHISGNLCDADPRAVSRFGVNEREKGKWQALHGTLKQDAFARLMTTCEDLRRDKPDLF